MNTLLVICLSIMLLLSIYVWRNIYNENRDRAFRARLVKDNLEMLEKVRRAVNNAQSASKASEYKDRVQRMTRAHDLVREAISDYDSNALTVRIDRICGIIQGRGVDYVIDNGFSEDLEYEYSKLDRMVMYSHATAFAEELRSL